MNDVTATHATVGRANTLLVFNDGSKETAIITSVVARACETGALDRIRFTGPGTFSEKTAQHILNVVLPVADTIFSTLGIERRNFELSIVNLGAASVNNVGLNVSGFSADVPVLLSILSAALQVPIPMDLAFTGHVASPDGDIRMVKGIPAKLSAIVKSDLIQTFFYPTGGVDNSLDSLSSAEKQLIDDAIIQAKKYVRTVGVSDIGELVKAVFSDDEVILASLKLEFFGLDIKHSRPDTVTSRAAAFFTAENHKRFWTSLELLILSGQIKKAVNLLGALAEYQIHQRNYPDSFGLNLYRLLQSLPPETRRHKITFPLIPLSDCIKLSQYAPEPNQEDVVLLMNAVMGEKVANLSNIKVVPQPAQGKAGKNRSLQSLIAQIKASTLTAKIRNPIDTARGNYVMESIIAGSHEEFNDIVTSFYLHLLRHTQKVFGPARLDDVGPDGLELLENAFSKQGGYQAALAEARHPTRGGLKYILDAMTEQYVRQQQEKYVNHIFKHALDSLNWEGKTKLMAAIMDWLKPHLPLEIASQPPERYAVHYQEIVTAYVNSMDQLTTVMRSL